MKRFVEGEDRLQGALLAHCLDDYVTEKNPVRVIEAFVNELDLATLGFDGVVPETTGRPAYHPATLLKIYLYGYLNRIPSSRRLERETQRNIELVWLTGRLGYNVQTAVDVEHRRYDGSEYEPFWAAAEGLDLPLSLHKATDRRAGSAGPATRRCATPAAARRRRSIRRCRCAI